MEGIPPAGDSHEGPPGAWLRGLAADLDARLRDASPPAGDDPVPVLPLCPPREVCGQVLRLSRDVAHATERMNAPLASYVAGAYVARRTAAGASPDDALAEVLDAVRAHLPAAGGRAAEGA